MRRRASFAVLKRHGFSALALLLGLLSALLPKASVADDSVTLEVLDHPGEVTIEAPVEEPKVVEPNAVEPVPQDLMIADAIKVQLNKLNRQEGHHEDDYTALAEFYRTRTGPALWLTTTGFSDRGEALLKAVSDADSWGLDPTAFPLPPRDYRPNTVEDQATTELAISLAALKYARAARGGLQDPKSINALYGHSPVLRPPDEFLNALSTSTALEPLLVGLHPKHEQFAKLRKALGNAKSENVDRLIRQNMDRWRWMPEELGESHVWLNIPEFMLHTVEGGKIVESEKVIVGAKGSPTPVLSADMTEIVLNPERIVPSAVIRRDVLPKLQRGGSFFGGSSNTAILDQYGITVKRGSKAVDPKTIDWRKINLSGLTFVQKPGRTNILGKVQFVLPNDQKVSIRDTTLRSKFARGIRADGTKFPRVENADKLAVRILSASNGSDGATVRQQIESGRTSRVMLTKPVPVHITYFTAVVGEDGQLKKLDDIYEVDELPVPGEAQRSRKPVNGSLATTSP